MCTFLKALSIGGLLLLLNACTSLEDFQKMSPESRAHKTCNNDVTVRHYKSQIYQFTNEINQIDALLLKGYKTHENCTIITYESNSSNGEKDKQKNSIKKICTEVVIPLSDYVYDHEKNRKSELVINLDNAKIQKQQAFDSCYNETLPMSAEQAFNHYDSN
mgnify:FL=1